MKRLMVAAAVLLASGAALAMPAKHELAEARELVAELMAPVLGEYKNKAKSATDVADASVAFAADAKNEAMRFLFLRGAVWYYAKDGRFGKAADAVEALKAKIKDVPPAEIVDVISGAIGRENVRKAPRLEGLLRLAQAQVAASRDAPRLAARLERISTGPVRRQYAEALAISGDWKKALAEFAKSGGEVAKMARADAAGTAGSVELGDFWWNYDTGYAGAECVFRNRAADYYRKALAKGRIDGLKKTLVEQRLASLSRRDDPVAPKSGAMAGRDVPDAPKSNAPASPTVKSSNHKTTKPQNHQTGLVARYSFADGLAPSVGDATPEMPEGATVANGAIALRTGSPLVFPAGTVPLAPFTVQVWASATDKGLGSKDDFIFKIASAVDSKDDGVFWTWRAKTKWVSQVGAFGEGKAVGHGKLLVDGQRHLYTVTGEKSGGGMSLKFYQDDTLFGELNAPKSWKKPPMLVLGGFVTPTYDEVRIYSRALPHAEIIKTANAGTDTLPESIGNR